MADQCPVHNGDAPIFTPPYPVPHKSKASLFKRFLTGWSSWIHTLFDKSYTMKMGEIRLPRLDFYIANDLEVVDRVMDDREKVFPKHPFLNDLLDPLIGNSVFSANGEDWEQQRAMVNPAFAHTNLKRVYPAMQGAVDDLMAQITALDRSKPIGVDPLMTHVAADIIYRTIFSVKLDGASADAIYRAFHRYQENIQPGAMLRLYGLPSFGYRRRAKKAAADIHAVFGPIVKARHDAFHAGTGEQQKDILQSLMQARHPVTDAPFTYEQIMEQVSTIFLAGHETAASTMTWALYLLSECPHLQEALAAEIERVAGDAPLGFEHLRGLDGVRNLFKETLRLYPPVSFFVREVTQPTTMRDKLLQKGAMLVVSPWLIQRNRDNWKCPHAFAPNRFDDPTEAEAAKRAYMPFGKGPRICIGAGFAQQEGILTLASVIRAFRLRYPDAPKPEPISRLTLRPKHVVKLYFDDRA
ncbi:cytochrome P450 [Sphingomonas montanisoli]|uniref:Cytochrome P450 n=1 Tax=Sphingomonas montanisoli TaxID=2606412 RepID=A0A5D9C2H2_9SPHN|nr:cytochrome P450 [Sphingomonas montanisoli]TZG25170.1 cytochrome P450 [Sphingomonas montanisoli]